MLRFMYLHLSLLLYVSLINAQVCHDFQEQRDCTDYGIDSSCPGAIPILSPAGNCKSQYELAGGYQCCCGCPNTSGDGGQEPCTINFQADSSYAPLQHATPVNHGLNLPAVGYCSPPVLFGNPAPKKYTKVLEINV